MEEPRDQVEDMMRRFGFNETEARAALHLKAAQDLFRQVYGDEAEAFGSAHNAFFLATQVKPQFDTLFRILALRVVKRDHPEGWWQPTTPGDTEE